MTTNLFIFHWPSYSTLSSCSSSKFYNDSFMHNFIIFLRFMYFLYDHLIPGTFVNCYADTDSMALATTRTRPMTEGMTPEEELRAVFDPIVKPEMRESWENNWKKWFVTLATVEDERFPGKLKREYS